MYEEKSPMSLRDTVQVFLKEKCTSHGYPRCRSGVSMGSGLRRTIWFFIAVVFTGYGSWQVYLTITDYYSYPTMTSTEVKQPVNVPFPSVTICPLQAVRDTSASKYIEAFSFYYVLRSKERDKPIWKYLIGNMTLEDQELEILEKAENFLMHKQQDLFLVSVVDLLKELQIEDLTDSDTIGYMKAVQQIRVFNNRRAPFPDERSIWTLGHAGRHIPWLESTWNGKYFDIRGYMESTFKNAFNSSTNSRDYLKKLFTKTLDNFRMSLQNQIKVSTAREDLQPLLELVNFGQGEDNPLSYSSDALMRYLLQRFLHPYTFHDTDIIQSCLIHGVNCFNRFFTSIHPRWKACYTFNNQIVNDWNVENHVFQTPRNRKTLDPVTLQAAGKDAGFSVRLRSRNSQKRLSMLNPIGGYVVAIGDSATMPRWDLHIVVPNTGHTDVAMKRTEITRVDAENGGDCQNENYFGVVFPEYEIIGVYDQNICSQLLVFFNILSECSCLMSCDVMGGVVGIENLTDTYDSCSFDQIPCTGYATDQALKSSSDACPPACREVKIEVSVTSVPYNLNGTAALAAHEWLDQPPILSCYIAQTESCEFQSFSTVNIFYASPSVDTIHEDLMYTPYTFVANLGGLAGLYIGMSLVSIVEVIELAIDLLTFPIRLRWVKRKRVLSTKDPQNVSWSGKTMSSSDQLISSLMERVGRLEKEVLRLKDDHARIQRSKN